MKTIPLSRVARRSLLVLSMGILSGCVTFQAPKLTFAEPGPDASQFRPVEGKSRIYFFHGPVRTCKGSDCIEQKLNFPFAIYVDGIPIGTVTSRDYYLRADISPGKHLIQWKDIVDSPEGEQGDTEISMEGGQAYFYRVSKGSNMGFKQPSFRAGSVKSTGQLENVGTAGQSEIQDKLLIAVDRDVVQRISGRASPSKPTQEANPSPISSPIPIGGKLAELKDMYERGLITKDEYDAKRKQFLDTWK